MPRSGYSRTVYSAVTHLLSSFRNDEALRRNPLVSRHFDASIDRAVAADRVRACIRGCIERIVRTAPPNALAVAERRRAILIRHDLEGATRTTVAGELGITERQMYRDRRAASELLAGFLRDLEPESHAISAPAVSIADPAELALHAALCMHAIGAIGLSEERAQAIARHSGDPQWRIAAACLSAQQFIDREDFIEGVRTIDAAERVLEENSRRIGASRASEFRAFFDVGRARIAWAQGHQKEALRLGRSGIDRFLLGRADSREGGDPAAQMLIRDAVHVVTLLTDVGDFSAADTLLGDVGTSIERLPHSPDYLELEWRAATSRFQTLAAVDHASIDRDAAQTMARAQHLGLPAIASEAALLRSWIAARRGDVPEARRLQDAALAFSETHDSTFERAITRAGAALIERKIGTPERALELARSSMIGLTFGTAGHAFSSYNLAQAQLACGNAEEAFEAARVVAEATAPREYVRGAAYLLMAESELMLDRREAALDYVDVALNLLAPYGRTYLLVEAQALRARVA